MHRGSIAHAHTVAGRLYRLGSLEGGREARIYYPDDDAPDERAYWRWELVGPLADTDERIVLDAGVGITFDDALAGLLATNESTR